MWFIFQVGLQSASKLMTLDRIFPKVTSVKRGNIECHNFQISYPTQAIMGDDDQSNKQLSSP